MKGVMEDLLRMQTAYILAITQEVHFRHPL